MQSISVCWVCTVWVYPSQWEGIDFSTGSGWFKALVFTLHLNPQCVSPTGSIFFICLCQKLHGSYPSAAFSSQINESTSTQILSLLWQHTHKQCSVFIEWEDCSSWTFFLNVHQDSWVTWRVTCLPSKHWQDPLATLALVYCSIKHKLVSPCSANLDRYMQTRPYITCEGLRWLPWS